MVPTVYEGAIEPAEHVACELEDGHNAEADIVGFAFWETVALIVEGRQTDCVTVPCVNIRPAIRSRLAPHDGVCDKARGS